MRTWGLSWLKPSDVAGALDLLYDQLSTRYEVLVTVSGNSVISEDDRTFFDLDQLCVSQLVDLVQLIVHVSAGYRLRIFFALPGARAIS